MADNKTETANTNSETGATTILDATFRLIAADVERISILNGLADLMEAHNAMLRESVKTAKKQQRAQKAALKRIDTQVDTMLEAVTARLEERLSGK